MVVQLHLTLKNSLSVVTVICVVALAVIPLKYSDQLGWLRWQIAIPCLAGIAVFAVIGQALIQSKEDHAAQRRDLLRDERLGKIELRLEQIGKGNHASQSRVRPFSRFSRRGLYTADFRGRLGAYLLPQFMASLGIRGALSRFLQRSV